MDDGEAAGGAVGGLKPMEKWLDVGVQGKHTVRITYVTYRTQTMLVSAPVGVFNPEHNIRTSVGPAL